MQKTVNQSQMQELAAAIASKAKAGDVFGLKGTLGAGKSFFASSFINALADQKITVLSPTFNLLYSYQTPKFLIHHFDLYRLKSSEELENIGFFDCLKNGICLIEWPEIAQEFLPKNYIEIKIEIKNESERIVFIK
ncbi:MAG: tRNA (adenosine(37)-N6)-threonylcarbamoyltransferase complex ATPase subunit type 1 TsaE [Pseudomonadota bacterium]